MTNKTQINRKMKRKTNTVLVQTIFLAKKANLLDLANKLAGSTKRHAAVNLNKINDSKKDVIIVPGKVLSLGEIKRKCKVYALSYSQMAREKLERAGCEANSILSGLKESKKLEGELIV
jgi:large subunit ribosomal protein L18e